MVGKLNIIGKYSIRIGHENELNELVKGTIYAYYCYRLLAYLLFFFSTGW